MGAQTGTSEVTINTNSTNINGTSMSNEEESELLPLLLLLWSKKILIGSLILVGCIVGALHALSKVPVYQADSLIQLETKNSGITLSEDITDLMSNESEAVSEIEIIKSRMVLGEAVKQMQLDIVSEPKSFPLIANLLSLFRMTVPEWEWLSVYGLQGEELQVVSLQVNDRFLGKPFLVRKTSDSSYQIEDPDGRVSDGAIGDVLTHRDNLFQIEIAEIYAKNGVEFKIQKQSELAAINRLRDSVTVAEKSRGSNLLSITVRDSKVSRAKETLDSILQIYVSQNIGRSSEEAEKSIAFLDQQLPVVLHDLSLAEKDLNEFRLQHESINLDLESASVLEQMVSLDTRISELSLEEAELSRLYTVAHPRYAAMLNKRAQLVKEKESLSSVVQTFPETQQEILKRTRNLEVNQHIYLQLLNKKQELNVLKASAVGNVRIIDNAMANPVPVGSGKLVSVILAAMLFMLAGCGYILLRFFLQRNVDSPEDITKLGIPVYATVPRSITQDKHNGREYVVSRDNPTELTVEALRSLRTSLHFGMLDNGKGIVSVTGPSPEIGKSFVATNLAYLAAESGAKVLLIDADMRRGSIGGLFGIRKSQPGLSEYLTGSAELEQVTNPVKLMSTSVSLSENKTKTKTSVLEPELEAVLDGIDQIDTNPCEPETTVVDDRGQLVVISRGSAPPNPSELLMKKRLPDFLDQVSKSYDLVVVDTPPVLAATDAMIIGEYADMNLMVVRHSKTSIHEMEEVVKAFSVNSVKMSGVILNSYDQKSSKFGQYSYAYGYQYNYESSD